MNHENLQSLGIDPDMPEEDGTVSRRYPGQYGYTSPSCSSQINDETDVGLHPDGTMSTKMIQNEINNFQSSFPQIQDKSQRMSKEEIEKIIEINKNAQQFVQTFVEDNSCDLLSSDDYEDYCSEAMYQAQQVGGISGTDSDLQKQILEKIGNQYNPNAKRAKVSGNSKYSNDKDQTKCGGTGH